MMKLGLFIQGGGHHVAAWRHPSTPHGASQSMAHHAEIAGLAERGLFDMIFFADSLVSFGPDDLEVWKRGAAVSRIEPVTITAPFPRYRLGPNAATRRCKVVSAGG